MPPPVSREIDRRTLPHREAGDVAGLVAIRGTAVIFSPSRFLRVTEQIIEHCLKIADPTDMRSEFEAGLLLVSAFFKDDTFIEEQEWRIVSNVKSIDDDMVGFREGKSMLAPYFRVKICEHDESAIEAATVGPCPHHTLSQSSVQMMFFRHGLGKTDKTQKSSWPEIYISSVPYRNW